MRSINLTLRQSMLFHYHNLRTIAYDNKYHYETRFPWLCIRCLKLTLVKYNTHNFDDNYHELCYGNLTAQNKLSTQYKYNAYMKEAQLKNLKRYYADITLF